VPQVLYNQMYLYLKF